MTLSIDTDFRKLIPPLSADEFAQLEANLLNEGCRDALVAWKHGDELTLVDGHNRFDICTKHGIEYKVTEREFESREDVSLWIRRNQLGRRNLPEPTRIRWALELKPAVEEQKARNSAANLKKGSEKPDDQNFGHRGATARTNEVLANDIGISDEKLRQAEYVINRAPKWITDAYDANEMAVNHAYKITKALETADESIRAYCEKFQCASLEKIDYLKDLLFDTVKRYGRENRTEGTFWEIVNSDAVQPGEQHEAVTFSTAPMLGIKKAMELKAKIHMQLAVDAKREELRQHAQSLPDKTYNVILADPPWEYRNTGVIAAAEHHYPTMPIEDISGLLSKLDLKLDKNAVLFMWATNPTLTDGFKVLEAWGFNYKTNMVWVKTELEKPGTGWYVRGRHELLLIATRGSFTPLENVSPPIGSVVHAPLQEHSRKPDDFYEIIERLYPNCNYIELFARRTRDGWDSWGNEVEQPAAA